MAIPPLAPSIECGSLGVFHLKRFWSAAIADRGGAHVTRPGETSLDHMLLSLLRLGLHQTLKHLTLNAPDFADFEEWIVKTAGTPDELHVERLNACVSGSACPESVREWLETIEKSDSVLSNEDLIFWKENGYVVLKNAVCEENRLAAEDAIWHHLGAERDTTDSWYGRTDNGIMVELIGHADLEANRHSARIQKAFTQIWETADLWVSADRCGFHPPQNDGWPFPGPDLHWDIDFNEPLTFGTQGILYLTNTPPEQGALTLVPGFHNKLQDWLATLDPETDPNGQDLHALGSKAIGGGAGDMIIWNQLLPHGSRPNLTDQPRIVQYINMIPGRTR